MANNDADVLIKLGLDLKDVKSEIATLKDEMKKQGESAGNAFSDSITSKIKIGAKSLVGAIAAVGATIAAGKFLSGAIHEAAEAQQGMVKLSNALRLTGDFTEKAVLDFEHFAESLERTTNINEEAVISLISLGKNMGFSTSVVKDLTTAAIELSAVTGKDLNASFVALGNTTSGELGKLGKAIPELQGLSKEALKAGGAIDFINERFGGTAESQTNTFQGSITRLGLAFGNLQKEIGRSIVETPAVAGLINGISEQVNKLTHAIADFIKQNPTFVSDTIIGFIKIGQAANSFLIAPIEESIKKAMLLFETVAKLPAIVVDAIAFADTGRLSSFGQKLLEDLQKGSASAAQTGFADNVNRMIASVQASVEQAQPLMFDAGKKVGESFKAGVVDPFANFENFTTILPTIQIGFETAAASAKNLAQAGLQAGSQIQNAIGQTASKGIQNLTNSLLQGQNAFKNFGKFILSALGDLSIQVGTTLLTAGIGMLALKFLDPTGAIAAGAALIALGTIMKSIGGGGESGVQTTAQGQNPGVVSPNGDFGQGFVTEEQKPKTNVVVNVQGNILDRRESGLAIAEIINETFGSNGVVVASA